MIPYIIFYFIVFLLSFKIKQEKWNIFDFILLTIMICYSGLRYEVGTDYNLYKNIFNYTINGVAGSAINRTGMGFAYFMYFIGGILKLKWEVFIFICSLLTITFFYIFFKKYSTKPGLAILCYVSLGFYTSSFNAFRQHLSLALVLLAYMLLKNKKNLLAILVSVISIMIHTSSIFPIALYLFFEKTKKIKVNLKVILLFSFILYIIFDFIFIKILSMFDNYSLYIDYEAVSGLGSYLNVLTYLFIAIFLINPNKEELCKINANNKKIISLFFIGIGIMILQLKNWLFVRLSIDFIIFLPVLLSDYYNCNGLRFKKFNSLITYLCLFVYYLFYINSFGGVIPYKILFFPI